MITAGIVGASGYTGGELIRLLLGHPHAEVTQVTSRAYAGQFIHAAHPHLRGGTPLRFIHPDALEPCNVLFLCLPHGVASREIDRFAALAPTIIDLSADFRLRDLARYERVYGQPHAAPQWVDRFVYGLPEVNREALRSASYASGVGCNATAVNLALLPFVRTGLLVRASAEVKVGSSEGGAEVNTGSHHPIRSGTVRVYKAAGHRHHAEVAQVLGDVPVRFAVTAIEMVRGVHVTAHVDLARPVAEKELWAAYRGAYAREPFVRLVAAKSGLHRLPEPRLVTGTNFCDIGWELDADDPAHGVIVAALDNLGKGAAGSAIQCMNLMRGLDECDGLRAFAAYP